MQSVELNISCATICAEKERTIYVYLPVYTYSTCGRVQKKQVTSFASEGGTFHYKLLDAF